MWNLQLAQVFIMAEIFDKQRVQAVHSKVDKKSILLTVDFREN